MVSLESVVYVLKSKLSLLMLLNVPINTTASPVYGSNVSVIIVLKLAGELQSIVIFTGMFV